MGARPLSLSPHTHRAAGGTRSEVTSGAGSDGEWRTGEGPAGRVGGRYERRHSRGSFPLSLPSPAAGAGPGPARPAARWVRSGRCEEVTTSPESRWTGGERHENRGPVHEERCEGKRNGPNLCFHVSHATPRAVHTPHSRRSFVVSSVSRVASPAGRV